MKTMMKLRVVLLLLVSFACSQESEMDMMNSKNETAAMGNEMGTAMSTKSSTDVFNTITGDVIGESTLHRNGNGITVNFKTTGLMSGHAYTLWWVVWNKPEDCQVPGECTEADFANAEDLEVQILYASGHVAGNNGKGNFTAHLNENDDSGSINERFGLPTFGGLQNAQTAEVHMVLRSHGPKIPGQVSEQIGSYEGGCTTFLPSFTEIPDEEGECGDIIAALHRL